MRKMLILAVLNGTVMAMIDSRPEPLPPALDAAVHDPLLTLLLESRIPARIAWVAADGTPRLAPMWFSWTGSEVVVSAFAGARKLADLVPPAPVAVSIDTEAFPYRSIAIRGVVTDLSPVPGLTPDYEAAAARYLGDQVGRRWCEALRPHTSQIRITIRPTRAVVADVARDSPFFQGAR